MDTLDPDGLIGGKRITLPERFEKTRVALLTFSAATIVLCLAAKQSQSVSAFYSIPIDLGWARLLAWFAALAYGLVFIVADIPTIWRIYGTVLEGTTWAQLSAQLSQFENTAIMLSKPVAELTDKIAFIRTQTEANLDRLIEEAIMVDRSSAEESLRSLVQRSHTNSSYLQHPSYPFPESIALYAEEPAERLGRLATNTKEAIEWLEKRHAFLDTSVISSAMEQTAIELRTLTKRLNRLSSGIIGHEKIRFMIWECLAPICLLFLATTSLCWVNRIELTAAIKVVAHPAEWSPATI